MARLPVWESRTAYAPSERSNRSFALRDLGSEPWHLKHWSDKRPDLVAKIDMLRGFIAGGRKVKRDQ